MRVIILSNPSAGGGRAVQAAVRAGGILRRRGVAFDLASSRSAEDLTRLAAEAAAAKPDLVLVVGGDGSWHFALNGLANSRIPMALVPCGRGNDFRWNMGLPESVDQAVDLALKGRPRDLDLIWTGKRYYIGVAGVGFDSEVTECANTRVPLLAGTLAYSVAVFYKIFEFKPKKLKIVHDHGVFEDLVMFAVFGNSKSYGGGMKICPKAQMDDGQIDVVVVKKIGLGALLRTMPKVFSGSHLPHPSIETWRTTRAELTSPEAMDLYGDGEYIGPVPTILEIRPRALRVIAP